MGNWFIPYENTLEANLLAILQHLRYNLDLYSVKGRKEEETNNTQKFVVFSSEFHLL